MFVALRLRVTLVMDRPGCVFKLCPQRACTYFCWLSKPLGEHARLDLFLHPNPTQCRKPALLTPKCSLEWPRLAGPILEKALEA